MLIGLHAISGCDTVPMLFGIGKIKALNTLATNSLNLMGKRDAGINDVMLESKKFVAACYGEKEVGSSKNRWAFIYFQSSI